ncbi:T9SS type A sorting domain-containing protein [Spirosoma montaniterrae]|uniref:Secretion system C-terminal sorting domain-containing protein n=1 Tax=Spirosoma montaniterrae TaxID=1178516 RepID=A0A1P9X4K5_9BACT|nr:T9SS type A sorting domain-containing protein [Spirosoma montaniterrae]AQG82580.1 hypothetical protein AWR27_18815 [Spirosoma montaniterrae]
MNNYLLLTRLFVIGLTVVSLQVSAQVNGQLIKITYPSSRAVFQRETDNTSTIYLSGSYYQPVDSVQARVQAEITGQGIGTNWVTIQRNPRGSIFQGSLRAQGGWYRLEVQAFAGGTVIARDEVRKIGIGEVFIITGQSNAQGFQNFGAVGASDDRVNCVVYDNTTANSLADPPAPTFQQLSANAIIGPRGQSAWCWGVLGDLIAQRFNVPVLFINTAWAATGSQNWAESAQGLPTKNIYAIGTPNELYPPGMPYANLVIALRYYCSLQGLRAILWQQGENDTFPLKTPRSTYAQRLQYLVNKTRADTDRYPAWVLARSSYTIGLTSQDVLQGQNDVINTYNNNVFAGPFTDNIQIPRFDDVHFGNRTTNNPGDKGLNDLGRAWFESLNSIFFASSRPLPPLPTPSITVACNTANNALTMTLPNLYQSYVWDSGQRTQSITVTQPRVYQAKLKDRFGNTFLAPAVDVQAPIQPTTPTVSLASQPDQPASAQQQICADSTLSLIANTSANSTAIWSNSAVGRAISLNQPGNYALQAVNVYGCRSPQVSGISLTVRPKVPTPTIEQVGTYSLQAVVPPGTDGQTDQFDWLRNGELIPQNGVVAKVTVTANYAARTKRTFRLSNGNNLMCLSDYSPLKSFVFNQADGGLSVYPNPSADGRVTVETVENLPDAEIDVFSLQGQKLFSGQVPVLNERKSVDLSGLSQGVYIVRVRASGFNVSRRIVINR